MKTDAYHHGDLRACLLKKARSRIETEGAEALSLASIARSLGVSQAAPYRHFVDRDDLLTALAAAGFDEFSAELMQATRLSEQPNKLLALGFAYIAFAKAHANLYQLMFASALLARSKEGDPLKMAAYKSFDILQAAVPESQSGRSRPRRALEIWVALHGAAMLATHGLLAGNPSGTNLEDLLEDIVS